MRVIVKQVAQMIPHLNHDEIHLLECSIEKVSDYEKVINLIEAGLEHSRSCPYCQSENVYRHGKASGLERYRCNHCHKTFNALTNTPLARLRKKELWLKHLELMMESTVLRTEARELGINLQTAFTWRHRFTVWLEKDTAHQLEGIVEADETYFMQSCKGNKTLARAPRKRGNPAARRVLPDEQVCVFTARDRSRHTVECVAGTGPLKGTWLDDKISAHITPDAVLVSDGAFAYQSFAQNQALKHVSVRNRRGEHIKGAFHIQNITAFNSRLKGWINGHFHGVATKYLDHYLWWMHELENKHIQTAADLFLATLSPNTTFNSNIAFPIKNASIRRGLIFEAVTQAIKSNR